MIRSVLPPTTGQLEAARRVVADYLVATPTVTIYLRDRPVLAKLDVHDRAELEAEYSALLRKAYPKQTFGTLFPFSRFFVVARAA